MNLRYSDTVRHDFQNELLHRVKRSYLKPCAHPWAALVLFDSLLVSISHVSALSCVLRSHYISVYLQTIDGIVIETHEC